MTPPARPVLWFRDEPTDSERAFIEEFVGSFWESGSYVIEAKVVLESHGHRGFSLERVVAEA